MAFLIALLGVAVTLIFAPRALASSSSTTARLADHSRAHAAHELSAASCRGARADASQASINKLELAVACLVNHERESWGLPSLAVNSHLDTAAQDWSRSMVAHGQFDHARLGARISAAGYDWEAVAENPATGYGTPMHVVSAWMASPSHCQNILNPDWRSLGTGVVDKPVPGWGDQAPHGPRSSAWP